MSSTWSGLGADANWSTPGNWDTVPTTGSDIIFPAGAAQPANTDDLGPLSFGTMTFLGTGYSISASNSSTAAFTSIDSPGTSTSNEFDVPIDLPALTTVTVDQSASTLVLGGVISGSSGLTTAGSGTVSLTANNAYSGATTVSAGTLLVNGVQGSSAVTVDPGATLGGIGTVGTTGLTGGTLAPGNPAPGVLIDTGNLTLGPDTSNNNSTFKVVLDGSSAGNGTGHYSQVQAAGVISLTGATLSGSLGPDFVPTLGSQYTIIDNTGTNAIGGFFAGQGEGSVIDFSGTAFPTPIPFTITYVGGTNSESIVLTELDASQTAVTFTPAAPVFGQQVTLTATVMGPTGSPTPSGSVQFLNGSTSLGTVQLGAGGTGSLNVSTLPVAGNSITAKYLGDTNFAPSVSPPVIVTVGQAATTTTFIPSTTTPVFGQSVALAATVQAVSPGVGTPTGTVKFFAGTTLLGMGTLANGSVSIATTTLPLGVNSITVQYLGDTNFSGQTTSPSTITVSQASTATTVSFTPTAPVIGQSITIGASVIALSPGGGTPTGTVTFMNGSTQIGTGTLANGSTSISISSLPAGTTSISTVYSGDADFKGNNGAGAVTVSASSTTTTLTVSNPNPAAGTSVTFTATVAAVSPGKGTPTGTVEFLDNGTELATATLSGGVATFTTVLPITPNSVTAVYSGDSNFGSSTSTAVTINGGTANDLWLNAVAQIELNRDITTDELNRYNKQLAAGASRQFVTNEIASTKEARYQLVQDDFNTYLGISGTPGEVVGAVKTAQVTHTSVDAALLGSKLFVKSLQGTGLTYYQGLMTAVFGFTFPAPFIERQLSDGVSPILVAEELLQSNRGKTVLLTNTYNTVQDRDPTQPEVVLYVGQMNNDDVLLRQIVVTLLASKEFFTKATSSQSSQ